VLPPSARPRATEPSWRRPDPRALVFAQQIEGVQPSCIIGVRGAPPRATGGETDDPARRQFGHPMGPVRVPCAPQLLRPAILEVPV
jgi:hypothetical protein